jgi:N-formylglutamate amidohydrolase
MPETFQLFPGAGPLLVSVPHAGTLLPADLRNRLSPVARAMPDTDWFIDQVWEQAVERGATLLVARYSRYVIDLNRPPGDESLYAAPGTGLVPVETFSGRSLYAGSATPDAAEIRSRLQTYWQPYHQALAAELERIRQHHGFVTLLDAHSINSRVPRLFEGRLPDLNLGSFDGASAAPGLVASAFDQLRSWPGHSCVLDGRFKGGYITRHYGQPERAVNALQLEMSQRVYMHEQPPALEPGKLKLVRSLAGEFLQCLLDWSPPRG